MHEVSVPRLQQGILCLVLMAVRVVIAEQWLQSANYTAYKPSTTLVMGSWHSNLEKKESTPNHYINILYLLKCAYNKQPFTLACGS